MKIRRIAISCPSGRERKATRGKITGGASNNFQKKLHPVQNLGRTENVESEIATGEDRYRCAVMLKKKKITEQTKPNTFKKKKTCKKKKKKNKPTKKGRKKNDSGQSRGISSSADGHTNEGKKVSGGTERKK